MREYLKFWKDTKCQQRLRWWVYLLAGMKNMSNREANSLKASRITVGYEFLSNHLRQELLTGGFTPNL
jgi:hypothetical protein